MYLGDFLKNAVVRFAWNASAANGASITRATNGTIHVYRDGNLTTEVTTGVTDTEDADSLPGVNVVAIDTSGAFYTVGSEFMVVLKSAVIDGQTVNAVLAHFSLERARVPVALTSAGLTALVNAAVRALNGADGYAITKDIPNNRLVLTIPSVGNVNIPAAFNASATGVDSLG
jgi:hypothetical protein